MTKKEKQIVRLLLHYTNDSCIESKPGKFDGWDCISMPPKVWPMKKWCQGCLTQIIWKMTKK